MLYWQPEPDCPDGTFATLVIHTGTEARVVLFAVISVKAHVTQSWMICVSATAQRTRLPAAPSRRSGRVR